MNYNENIIIDVCGCDDDEHELVVISHDELRCSDCGNAQARYNG